MANCKSIYGLSGFLFRAINSATRGPTISTTNAVVAAAIANGLPIIAASQIAQRTAKEGRSSLRSLTT